MARSRVVRGRAPKRHGDWTGSLVQTALTALAASSAVASQTFVGTGHTIIRTRGLFTWGSDQVAGTEDQIGAVGICVVSDQAVSVGITAIPHPATDAAWDGWFWHSYFASRFAFASAAGGRPGQMHEIVIDSKAMRKVTAEETMVVVVENTSAAGGIVFSDQLRIYTKSF